MASLYTIDKQHPISLYSKRANLSKSNLCKLVHISQKTLRQWYHDSGLIPLNKLILISGVLGIPVEELVYSLIRYKPQVNKDGKVYLSDIRKRVDEEFGDSL